MGISIWSGAVTTLGAGIFLYGGTIVFFERFAVSIVLTILFSLLYSLIFFQAFLHAFGPNGKIGDIGIFWRACVETCKESGQHTDESQLHSSKDVRALTN